MAVISVSLSDEFLSALKERTEQAETASSKNRQHINGALATTVVQQLGKDGAAALKAFNKSADNQQKLRRLASLSKVLEQAARKGFDMKPLEEVQTLTKQEQALVAKVDAIIAKKSRAKPPSVAAKTTETKQKAA